MATHTYQDLSASSPGWSYSTARRLIVDLIRAAIEHLPGYAAAPRTWHRPPLRTGCPIGLREQWTPVDEHIQWLTPSELATKWDTASLVLLTIDALADLPAGLPRRDGVYVVAGSALTSSDWAAIAQSPSLLLVQLPAGRGLVARRARVRDHGWPPYRCPTRFVPMKTAAKAPQSRLWATVISRMASAGLMSGTGTLGR